MRPVVKCVVTEIGDQHKTQLTILGEHLWDWDSHSGQQLRRAEETGAGGQQGLRIKREDGRVSTRAFFHSEVSAARDITR